MAFDFHFNKPQYFNQQFLNAKTHVIPFIEQTFEIKKGMKVLEIGCAEGGVLKPFVEKGCQCVGVELSQSKVDNAHIFMKNEVENGSIKFICKDIYALDFKSEFLHYFDIIVLKDTIEHIHEQEKIISYLHDLLAPKGCIFFGFPPWYMPWGGHQQICKSKFLMYLPYFHLLPMWAYKAVLKIFGETTQHIEILAEIKETGISTRRFEKIIQNSDFKIENKRFYLVNPIYTYKFGWKPRLQPKIISAIPVLNDVLCTTVFYTIKSNV